MKGRYIALGIGGAVVVYLVASKVVATATPATPAKPSTIDKVARVATGVTELIDLIKGKKVAGVARGPEAGVGAGASDVGAGGGGGGEEAFAAEAPAHELDSFGAAVLAGVVPMDHGGFVGPRMQRPQTTGDWA